MISNEFNFPYILKTFLLIFVLSLIRYIKKINYFDNSNKLNESPKISVFLPIYNKAKYLIRSITSIQKQTLKEIEIIAVNDNSIDNSLDILNQLAQKDKRIKIINNVENRGLLYSRGMGILNSNGEYLMNLDPDDEINGKNSLKLLYNTAKNFNLDMLIFLSINTKSNEKSWKYFEPNKIVNQPRIYQSAFKNGRLNDYLITNKLLKKELFKKIFNIFKPQIYGDKWIYHEDNIFSILAYQNSNSTIFINKIVYIYHQNEESSMSNRGGIMEVKNLLYRNEMYKKLFLNEKLKIYEGWLEVLLLLKKYINIIKQDVAIKNKCIKEMKELKEFINYNKFEQSKLNEIDKFLMQIME